MDTKVVALVLFVFIFSCSANAYFSSSLKNKELYVDDDYKIQVNHNIAKRGVPSAITTVASSTSFSDVKTLTKLIFQNLKKNFKAARVSSKGKSWAQFLRALVGACTSAVTQAVTDLITMKAKAKVTSFASNSFKSITGMFGK